MPALIPVSATIILIRLIESFKIIDLPNVLTYGGPGTASESLTLQAFFVWRGFNLGQSAAIAYTLLIVVTLVGLAYVTTVIRRTHAVWRGGRVVSRFLAKRSALDLSPRAKVLAYLALIGWAIVVLFPLYWLAITSFKTPAQVSQRTVLHPGCGLPADARQLAPRAGHPGQRHDPRLLQHGGRGGHQHDPRDDHRGVRCVRPGAASATSRGWA